FFFCAFFFLIINYFYVFFILFYYLCINVFFCTEFILSLSAITTSVFLMYSSLYSFTHCVPIRFGNQFMLPPFAPLCFTWLFYLLFDVHIRLYNEYLSLYTVQVDG